MRFTNETGLMQVLKYSSQRLTRILTVPLTNGYRKLRRVLNPNGFTTRVMADVRKGGKELITGKNGDRLAPQDTATRAEVATLLMRYLQTDAE